MHAPQIRNDSVPVDSTGAQVDGLVSNKNEIEIIKTPPVI